ncbi:MAG: Zn-ribbon domain-containing OB-fold protein [Alphaproteobacteria bacterium]|nr:Zn-ribbon domain-containing OB-fold protein [Alphaproteobacteria bacterium]
MTNPERVYADPSINMETEAYWEATKQNKLLLKKCDDCGETHWYPRAICPHCSSSNTCWYEGSGKGKIYSFSVMRRVEVPYVMAYVTLDEGVSLLTNIVECDFDNLSIDQDVEVVFRATQGDQALPLFRPVA